MKRKMLVLTTLVSALSVFAGTVVAQNQAPVQDRVYGSQLMTQQERFEYHNRLRAARTAQERNQIRNEHHQQMRARARAQGMQLPDMPPARGGGMGPGRGMGAGGGRGR